MINRLLRDSILSGMVIGIISISLNYIVLYNFDRWYQYATDNGSLFFPPRIQLIVLAANILLFRFMIVKWNRPETARGILLIVFISVTAYMLNRKYEFI